MTGYSRTRTFTNGETINAADFTTEFDNLTAAFNGVSGHDHTGGTTGKAIGLIGSADLLTKITTTEATDQLNFYTKVASAAALQFSVKDGVIEPNADSDVDIGTTAKRFKDLYIDSATVTGTVTTNQVDVAGQVLLSDTSTIKFGTDGSNYFEIYKATGVNGGSFIKEVGGGAITLQGQNGYLRSDTKAVASWGSLDIALKYNDANRIVTTDAGVTVTGVVDCDGLKMDDGEYAQFGTSNDLQIFHSGVHSYIKDRGTGILSIQSDGDSITLHDSANSREMAKFSVGGTASLNWAGGTGAGTKLSTTATGVTVTGKTVSDGFETSDTANYSLITREDAVNYALYVQNKAATGKIASFRIGSAVVNEGTEVLGVGPTSIDVTGNITVSGTVDGRDVAVDGTKLNTIAENADVTTTAKVVAALTAGSNITIAANGTIASTDTNTTYSTATSGTAGLVKIGYTENAKNYPVELASGKMFVNVPWTDSQTAGTGLTLNSNTFSVNAAQTQITSVGVLDGGSITSNFGSINIGSNTFTTTGSVNAKTINFTGGASDLCSIESTVNEPSLHLDFKLQDDDADSFRFRFKHYIPNVFSTAVEIKPDASVAARNKFILDVTGTVVAEGFSGTGGAANVITHFSTDGTFSSSTNSLVPTALAVKTYVDAQAEAASDGDITSVVAGTGLTGGAVSGNATLNVIGGVGIVANANDIAIDLSELTDMTADVTGATEVILNNGGTDSRKAITEIKLSAFNNDSNWTSNAGTVTAVIGVGAITSTGGSSPTIGLTLNNLNQTTSDGNADFFPVINDAGTQFKIPTGNIKLSGFENDSSFSSTVGTVTAVAVGTGLDITNSTTTPSITLSLDEIAASTTNSDADKFLVTDSSGVAHRIGRGNVKLSDFNDDLVYTNNAGTVTSVGVGTGLDVSNATTTPSISLDLSELTSSTTSADAYDLIALKSDGTLQKVRRANITLAGFDGTIPQGTVTAVTATAPVVSTGGATPVISIPLSTNSVDGYMSSEQAQKLAGIAEGATAGGGISSVTVGTGLDVANGSTAPGISLDLSELATTTTDDHGDYFVVTDTNSTQRKITKANINISGFNNNSGFTSNAGTVTSVGGGTGTTSSGGSTPSISLNLNELITSTGTVASFATVVGSATRKVAPSAIPLSGFNNDAGFTSTAGTVTSVSVTGPLEVSSGTTTPALSMSAATNSNNGYMTTTQAQKLAGIAEGATVGSTGPTSIIAGNGLAGGGTSGAVNIAVGAGDGISTTTSTIKVDTTVVRTAGTQSIGGAKTLTDPLVISTDTNDSASSLTIQDTDQGAGQRPVIRLDRQSASPAVGDDIGAIEFYGRREGPGVIQYAEIKAEITSTDTNTAKGQLVFAVSDYSNHSSAGFKDVLTVAETGLNVAGNVIAESFQGQMKTELATDTNFSVTETIAKRNSRIVYTNNGADSVFNLPTIFTGVNAASITSGTTWTLINYSDQRIKIQAPVGYTLSRLVGGAKLDTSSGGFSYLNAYGACEIMAQGLGSTNFLVYGSELS